MLHPALFLDRDGVINKDTGYVHRRENFEFIDGIFELVALAKRERYQVVVVTNQAGIGRGYFSEADFHLLMEWVCRQFAGQGGAIDHIYFCPDHPEHGVGKYKRDTGRRKPAPGMILEAAGECGLNLADSILVGDKPWDLQAGIAAGVGRNILFDPHQELPQGCVLGPVVHRLADVAGYLQRRRSGP
jgi:D-glycero-D-manno-heptose 1,7-bisphosphate phosphatase